MHIWKDNHLARSRLDAARKSLRDRRLGKLHVGVTDYDIGTGRILNQLLHRAEHLVGFAFTRAVVNKKNRFHMVLKMSA